jgi:hypothetical protein
MVETPTLAVAVLPLVARQMVERLEQPRGVPVVQPAARGARPTVAAVRAVQAALGALVAHPKWMPAHVPTTRATRVANSQQHQLGVGHMTEMHIGVHFNPMECAFQI